MAPETPHVADIVGRVVIEGGIDLLAVNLFANGKVGLSVGIVLCALSVAAAMLDFEKEIGHPFLQDVHLGFDLVEALLLARVVRVMTVDDDSRRETQRAERKEEERVFFGRVYRHLRLFVSSSFFCFFTVANHDEDRMSVGAPCTRVSACS